MEHALADGDDLERISARIDVRAHPLAVDAQELHLIHQPGLKKRLSLLQFDKSKTMMVLRFSIGSAIVFFRGQDNRNLKQMSNTM